MVTATETITSTTPTTAASISIVRLLISSENSTCNNAPTVISRPPTRRKTTFFRRGEDDLMCLIVKPLSDDLGWRFYPNRFVGSTSLVVYALDTKYLTSRICLENSSIYLIYSCYLHISQYSLVSFYRLDYAG